MTTKGMSKGQIMAQVHRCIQKSMQKHEGQREALIGGGEEDGNGSERSEEDVEEEEEFDE